MPFSCSRSHGTSPKVMSLPQDNIPPTQPAPYKQRNERAYSYSAHNSRP